MQIEITEVVKKEVSYLKAECGVRYWDDAEVNGQQDDETSPRMPFASPDAWNVLIELDSGRIVDWPQGTTASVHYKVCDDGRYALLDADKREVVSISGYVPEMMCPKDNGYGDYVIMDIGADGTIADWRIDFDPFETPQR